MQSCCTAVHEHNFDDFSSTSQNTAELTVLTLLRKCPDVRYRSACQCLQERGLHAGNSRSANMMTACSKAGKEGWS